MLTVRICHQQELCLLVTGHAGAGKRGQDLVCAAASILTYTAAATAQKLYEKGELPTAPYIRLAPGSAQLRVSSTRAGCDLFEMIGTGFDLLAAQYPKNVRLIRQ